jgi:hypothetical protein
MGAFTVVLEFGDDGAAAAAGFEHADYSIERQARQPRIYARSV